MRTLKRRFIGLFIALVVVLAQPVGLLAQVPAHLKKEAIALSVLARGNLDKGQFLAAAKMYDEAYRKDPQTHGYQFSAARARHKAGKFKAAKVGYEAFLAKVGDGGGRLATKASAYLLEVNAQLKAVRSRKSTGPQPGGASAASNTMPLIMVSAGGVLALGGAAVFGLAVADRASLDDKLGDKNDAGLIKGIEYADAQTEADAIGQKKTMAVVAAGIGAALVGVGAVLWPSSTKVTMTPTARGFSLQARF